MLCIHPDGLWLGSRLGIPFGTQAEEAVSIRSVLVLVVEGKRGQQALGCLLKLLPDKVTRPSLVSVGRKPAAPPDQQYGPPQPAHGGEGMGRSGTQP